MSIVTISQSLGSLGDEIGRELAGTLSYEFADREIIFRAAERFGEGLTELQHVTDERPTLWERFTETRGLYVTYVEAIIWEMAVRGNVVLVGRGATVLLRGVRHALRVRVTAPEALRAKRVEEQQGLAPDAAPGIVRHSDRERAARVRFLYHVDWDDPLLYDLVLNTERLAPAEAVRMVQDALRTERCQPTPQSLAEVRDESLAAQARAALLADPTTRKLLLTLTCAGGHVSISGMVGREEMRHAAQEIVRKIPGVTGVRNDVVVIPPRRPSSVV